MYQGNNCKKKTFEFFSEYRHEPFKVMKHPIDSLHMKNYYNKFLDDLDDSNIIQIIYLPDYLDIKPLLQLICFKLSYRLRDMDKYELIYFYNCLNSLLVVMLITKYSCWCCTYMHLHMFFCAALLFSCPLDVGVR